MYTYDVKKLCSMYQFTTHVTRNQNAKKWRWSRSHSRASIRTLKGGSFQISRFYNSSPGDVRRR